MTDLTPNDLSHLSDDEFNALCPQGEHAPGPEPLSPAAQAVMDAVEDDCIHPADLHRTAAAQVVLKRGIHSASGLGAREARGGDAP
jgi:hypothetical protein